MRLPIVMLSGPAGSGKDTVAGFLRKHAGAHIIAQADPMKELARDLFGFSHEQLWGPSERRAEKVPIVLQLGRLVTVAPRWLESIGLAGNPFAFSRLREWAFGIVQPGACSARHVLQTLGTEWGRAIDSDLWVNLALRRARELLVGGAPLVVVTDGRFRNELLAVRATGGATVRLVTQGAGLTGEVSQHSSETEQASIPDSWFDAVLLNDKAQGLAALDKKVASLLGSLALLKSR